MDIKTIETFFKDDLQIKKIILSSRINSIETEIEYQNKLLKSLQDIEYIIEKNCKNFNLMELLNQIKQKFNQFKNNLVNTKCSYNNLTLYYENYFCSLNEKIIDEVKHTFIGYTRYNEKNIIKIIENSSSINEILHIIHSYIINNDKLISEIPIQKTKKYNNGYPINIRGKVTEIAEQIYNALPQESRNGWTDIISFSDRIIMMVRDKGHALTLEIESENNKYYISYFIPKICSIDGVNKLPGVKKVESTQPTSGMFETTKERLAIDTVTFIESVPDDLYFTLDSSKSL